MSLQSGAVTIGGMAIQADGPVPGLTEDPTPFEPRVLVVYESFAFATAVVQRLVDHYTVVEIARGPGAARRLGEHGRYEAVVLCPYLKPSHRDKVLDQCFADEASPAVIEVRDVAGGHEVVVCEPPDRPGGAARDAFRPMIDALASTHQLSQMQHEGSDGVGLR